MEYIKICHCFLRESQLDDNGDVLVCDQLPVLLYQHLFMSCP